ncbi:hypothetical protein R54767_01770 [Paraburkholderia gardini]|uniref:Uncharacterized protein n=2 Tax=Paraburkholderia gardini TaxID=2823469 RepID=A0ABM8U269_9BURK|nr:hypothetical protein R54767_01770 [Paraburkholderia gardini]
MSGAGKVKRAAQFEAQTFIQCNRRTVVTEHVQKRRRPPVLNFPAQDFHEPTGKPFSTPVVIHANGAYLNEFIAIIWISHHHLMRFVGPPTLAMIWLNFVHLFLVSLLPFATAWVATTRFASSSVMFYAGLFICIDTAYNIFEYQVLAHADAAMVSARMRRTARYRSLIVLAGFTTAMLVAIVAPHLGFGLICAALMLHLRPDISGIGA